MSIDEECYRNTVKEQYAEFFDSFPPIIDEVVFEQKGSPVDRPSHYTAYEIEPIDYINKNKMGYNEGNVIKYISRHRMKNKAEDVRKAMKYCEFILRYEYGELP